MPQNHSILSFLKVFFKSILYFIILVVGIILIMSLFVPVYHFDEPTPFSGDYLHNPYKDMDSTQWIQCNFHAHTRRFGGVTDGRLNTNEMVDSIYSRLGFDHVGISDYMYINDYESDKEGYIPGYEHGYGVFKIHQLCLGAERVRYIDYFVFQSLSMKQHTLNKLSKDCKLAIPAHPSFVDGGYLVKDMKYLSNYKLMEVINGFRLSMEHWDMALSNGHRIYLIANDDSHDVQNPTDVGYRFTMINSPENKADKLLSSLVSGNAVGVDFFLNRKESLEDKFSRIKKDLPYLHKAVLKDDTLIVSASKPIALATFIGQNGTVLKTEKNVKEASYFIQPTDLYVRTTLKFKDGTTLYLNPITRHNSPNIVDQSLDHISYGLTAVLWLAYTGIIVFVIRLIIKRKRKKIS